MRKPPVPGWEETTSKEKVFAPSHDGKESIVVEEIEVPAWVDPDSGEIYLDDRGTELLENAKARHLGLLSPGQMRSLRETLNLNQKEITRLLQIGERSWSRWESGRERPSRSMNVLLCALFDGKIDVHYLREIQDPETRNSRPWQPVSPKAKRSFVRMSQTKEDTDETGPIAA